MVEDGYTNPWWYDIWGGVVAAKNWSRGSGSREYAVDSIMETYKNISIPATSCPQWVMA